MSTLTTAPEPSLTFAKARGSRKLKNNLATAMVTLATSASVYLCMILLNYWVGASVGGALDSCSAVGFWSGVTLFKNAMS